MSDPVAEPVTIDGLDDLRLRVGSHLGYSDYLEITQERVDQFAEVTGDRQWIHIDVDRAREGPFGATIAHGFLTLSLAPALGDQVFQVEGVRMAVNYGLGRVRYPSPVPVGSKLRVGVTLLEALEVPGGVQTTMEYVFEVESAEKPVCVAQLLARFYD